MNFKKVFVESRIQFYISFNQNNPEARNRFFYLSSKDSKVIKVKVIQFLVILILLYRIVSFVQVQNFSVKSLSVFVSLFTHFIYRRMDSNENRLEVS